jgi:predicted transcriptional regulator of viral defense system
VIDSLQSGQLFFVNDIQKITGLDNKSLKTVLGSLLRHGHINKNEKGQWFLPIFD